MDEQLPLPILELVYFVLFLSIPCSVGTLLFAIFVFRRLACYSFIKKLGIVALQLITALILSFAFMFVNFSTYMKSIINILDSVVFPPSLFGQLIAFILGMLLINRLNTK